MRPMQVIYWPNFVARRIINNNNNNNDNNNHKKMKNYISKVAQISMIYYHTQFQDS